MPAEQGVGREEQRTVGQFEPSAARITRSAGSRPDLFTRRLRTATLRRRARISRSRSPSDAGEQDGLVRLAMPGQLRNSKLEIFANRDGAGDAWPLRVPPS